MAWQLIYTSAPRLLEAGRTGFGTVARHRAVGGMLASAVERFSQFARLPGHDPRRVIHACRTLTVGASTYHVLSCLQDAGSDYTGRTNHIAHHLIAEPREVRALAAAGITPADVLAGMPWRASWTEGPRFLDTAEEVDLSTFRAPTSSAWACLTGDPAAARILWSREVLKGCYLLLPGEVSALELFNESLHAAPAQAWQSRFTTCLEPTDDLADFRWVGMPAASPLRTQAETSSRLVLDLTRPATLPAPPEPETTAAPEAATPPPPAAAVPLPAGVQEKPPAPNATAEPASTMGGWSPETRQRKAAGTGRSYVGISLLAAALLILIVGGGLVLKFIHHQQENQSRGNYEAAIEKTWKEHALLLTDTRKFLEEQPDVDASMDLLKAHQAFFRSMKALLSRPDQPVELTLPTDNRDDLSGLAEKLKEWAALHQHPWSRLGEGPASASSMLAAHNTWQQARTATWKKLRDYLGLQLSPPPADAQVRSLKETAKEQLKKNAPAPGSRAEWEQLFDLSGRPPMDSEVRHWLELWAKLESAGAYAASQKVAADQSLPAWLREKAAAIQAPETPMADTGGTGKPPPKEPQKPRPPVENADAPTATNDLLIRIYRPNENPADTLAGLAVSADMQLYVGSAWAAHPPPDGKTEPKDGELKPWAAVSLDNKDELKFGPTLLARLTDMILFSSEGKLLSLPDSIRTAAEGARLVARSKDGTKVLFDLRLLPLGSVTARPVFPQVIKAGVDNTKTATLHLPAGFLKRLHLPGHPGLVFSLRLEGSASQQKLYALRPAGDTAFDVAPLQHQLRGNTERSQIENQVRELEAGISKDDDDMAKLEGSKLPAREKEARKEAYAKARADKELKLAALQAQLHNMDASQTPQHFDLLPGSYTLMLEQPYKIELCKLHVVPAADFHSKPNQP